MARRGLPLCITCGAWSPGEPACGHAPDPRLHWSAPPWWDGLGDLFGMALFTVLLAAVLMGVGPLLWALFYDWPPRGWIETFGVVGVALVSIPGWVVGVGLVLSIPGHWRGRCWQVRDARASADDVTSGFVFIRRGAPVRGSVTRAVCAAVPSHVEMDMSSVTAAENTGDLGLVLAAALAGLAAGGRLALSLVETTGWSRQPHDEAPRPLAGTSVHVRGLSPRTSDASWLEGALLDLLAHGRDVELRHPLRDLIEQLALEIGYTRDDDGAALRWPADAPATPAGALRALVRADPPDRDDPGPVVAALAAWRARDPARVGPVLDLVADLTAELLTEHDSAAIEGLA